MLEKCTITRVRTPSVNIYANIIEANERFHKLGNFSRPLSVVGGVSRNKSVPPDMKLYQFQEADGPPIRCTVPVCSIAPAVFKLDLVKIYLL